MAFFLRFGERQTVAFGRNMHDMRAAEAAEEACCAYLTGLYSGLMDGAAIIQEESMPLP